jgi:hypothetical protein
MLHLRNRGGGPSREGKQEDDMEYITRALGLAVALGTGGLMFALALV